MKFILLATIALALTFTPIYSFSYESSTDRIVAQHLLVDELLAQVESFDRDLSYLKSLKSVSYETQQRITELKFLRDGTMAQIDMLLKNR